MNRSANIRKKFSVLLGAAILLSGSAFALPGFALSGPQASISQQTAPDKTKNNKGDARKGAVTADQQKSNPADRETTKKIRASIMSDKSLSTYAHNIKVITQDGKVTLKGPVRSEQEKTDVEAKAAAVAGSENVTSEIEIAPPKS